MRTIGKYSMGIGDRFGCQGQAQLRAFVQARKAGMEKPLEISKAAANAAAGKFLAAVEEAGRIYRHIAKAKGEGTFITEVSMDESDSPQTPAELLFILAALVRG